MKNANMRKKFYILILLNIFFYADIIFAATEPQPLTLISFDTTWQGNITLDNGVAIQKGATLTILPGSKIILKKKSNNIPVIQVEGNLIACGTKDQIIEFDANIPLPNTWEGIYFLESSDSSKIQYCKIQYGKVAIKCEKSSPLISNNLIINCSTGVETLKECYPIIQENLIKNNTNGIKCSNGSTPLIIKNIIEGNKNYGLSYAEGSLPAIFENNFFENEAGILAVRPQSNPLSSFNNFEKNRYGIFISQSAGIVVDNCTFKDNDYGILTKMMTNSFIKNCLFTKNKTAISGKTWSQYIIENNDLIDNQVGISLYLAGNSKITNNNIYNNSIGIETILNSAEISRNNFDNLNYNIKFYKTSIDSYQRRGDNKYKTLNPGYNWWGEQTTKELNQKKNNISTIWDGYDVPVDLDRGFVCHESKFKLENWQKEKIIDCGKNEKIKKEMEEKNSKILKEKIWQQNVNELKGKEEM